MNNFTIFVLQKRNKLWEEEIKKQKKENALDIISKSLQKNINANYPKGSGSILINL